MVELQKNLEKIQATNTQVVAISFDKVEVLEKFAAAGKIEFPLLSDKDSATIKAFKIHNQRGLPHPGTFIVDSQGKVLHKLHIDGYRKRHTSADLIAALKSLDAE